MPSQSKRHTLQTKMVKHHTLSDATYLHNPYKGVPPSSRAQQQLRPSEFRTIVDKSLGLTCIGFTKENMHLLPKIAALTGGNQRIKFAFRYVHL